MNEFRAALADQAGLFITRTESLARADSNGEKIDGLASRLDKLEGNRGGLRDGWGYLVGVFGVILAIAAVVVAVIR